MPRVETQEREIEAALAAWAEFEDPSAWRRSKRGNLWREYEGRTITVFKRGTRWYAWCIASADGTRFSRVVYETFGAAVEGVGHELGVGY